MEGTDHIGDGTLPATNDRLIFVPQSSLLPSIQAVVRGTTNPVPCGHLTNDTDLLTPVL